MTLQANYGYQATQSSASILASANQSNSQQTTQTTQNLKMQDALNAKLKFDSVGESGLNTIEKEALKTFFPSALNKTEQVKSENLLDIRV